MNPKIRVLVVDDHPFFRRGVAQWLNQRPELICCGEAGSAAEARQALRDLKPDVMFLDLHLGDGDGLDVTSEVAQNYPTVRVIVLSHLDEDVYAHRAIRAGARGYIMKSEATESALKAIETVMAGDIYVSRPVAARALQRLFPDSASAWAGMEHLSDREVQVFQLLGTGSSNHEIAATLKISPKTVETYRENLKRKLRLPDANALVTAARHWVESGRFKET
jgi:DNA-binding NarL/FixJ family response regulator